jgi:hypothetical protein
LGLNVLARPAGYRPARLGILFQWRHTLRIPVSVLAKSVKRCLPSGAAIFNCPILSDASVWDCGLIPNYRLSSLCSKLIYMCTEGFFQKLP